MISKINSGAEFSIQLKPAIPVYLVYFTSWVTPAGIINFRNDVYGLDERLTKEIFDKQNTIVINYKNILLYL